MDIFNPDAKFIEAHIWEQLTRALHDKHHPWRLMSIATTGAKGPQTRMVVMRGVNTPDRRILFYTDRRSGKVSDVQIDPRAQLLFWDPRHKVQLRVSVIIAWEQDEERIEACWSKEPPALRRDYTDPADVNLIHARGNFMVGVAGVHAFDWLILRREGHRRFTVNYAEVGGVGVVLECAP